MKTFCLVLRIRKMDRTMCWQLITNSIPNYINDMVVAKYQRYFLSLCVLYHTVYFILQFFKGQKKVFEK